MEFPVNWENGEEELYFERTVDKICQKTDLTWDKILSLALFRIRVAPRSRLQLSPYEILYKRPFLYSELLGRQISDRSLSLLLICRWDWKPDCLGPESMLLTTLWSLWKESK